MIMGLIASSKTVYPEVLLDLIKSKKVRNVLSYFLDLGAFIPLHVKVIKSSSSISGETITTRGRV